MKKYLLYILSISLLALAGKLSAQSNMQITFMAGGTPLAGQDTVYMWSGIGWQFPGDFNHFTTGQLGQGNGLGRMTSIGQDQWSICLEPFSYFSQGTEGTVPTSYTIYEIGYITFHDPSGSILVQLNNNSANFYIDLLVNSTTVINPPVSNSIGQLSAAYQSCTLGINDLQISNGVLTNFPNPVTENTKFIYTLKSSGKVSLKVYNAIGQIVKNVVNDEFQTPKTYSYTWIGDNDSGRKLFNGVYYYSLSVDGKVIQTNKLVISR